MQKIQEIDGPTKTFPSLPEFTVRRQIGRQSKQREPLFLLELSQFFFVFCFFHLIMNRFSHYLDAVTTR